MLRLFVLCILEIFFQLALLAKVGACFDKWVFALWEALSCHIASRTCINTHVCNVSHSLTTSSSSSFLPPSSLPPSPSSPSPPSLLSLLSLPPLFPPSLPHPPPTPPPSSLLSLPPPPPLPPSESSMRMAFRETNASTIDLWCTATPYSPWQPSSRAWTCWESTLQTQQEE